MTIPAAAPFRLRRRALMQGCAIAASMIALSLGGPALAQVAGSGSVVSGTATISPPAGGAPANTTQVVATTAQTVINWTPTDTSAAAGDVDFLPTGNAMTFYGPGDYIILNRIIPSGAAVGRGIALNGDVASYLGTPIAGVPPVRGGNIWFYSPDGIAIGGQASINVGALVLTTNDILTTGGLLGPSGEIRFRGASASTASVNNAGTIVAGKTNPGSAYVAVVSPRIVQNGTVLVDGSAAYVAAEQVDIATNNGLFDISVLVGAEGGVVIDHGGRTGGPAHVDGVALESRIYMVAVPKAAAVTMLVSGLVGFDDAAAAAVEPNGAVRLSAGFNITSGEIDAAPASAAAASLGMTDIIFNSAVVAHASNNLVAAPTGTIYTGPPIAGPPPLQIGRVFYLGGATLTGDNIALVQVGNQQVVGAVGAFNVISGGRGTAPGTAQVNVLYNPANPGAPGIMAVTGQLTVDASRAADPVSGDATGGIARVNVNGGLLQTTDLFVRADGVAGTAAAGGAGTGRGGTAEILVNNVTGVLNVVTASATALGFGGNGTTGTGGNGFGGSARATISNGGALTALQGFALGAQGVGGNGAVVSGNGTGGTARLNLTTTNSSYTSPTTQISAEGLGGTFGPLATERGGDGVGGTAEIISGGQLDAGTTSVFAGGFGRTANKGDARGGDGIGGIANISLSIPGSSASFAATLVLADGSGGAGFAPVGNIGTAGAGSGGAAAIVTDSVTANITGDLTLSARGDSDTSGASILRARTGGQVDIRAESRGGIFVTGALNADTGTTGDLNAGTIFDQSADHRGGTIFVLADNFSRVQAGTVNLTADSFSPNVTVAAGAASGGDIILNATNNGVIATNGGALGFNVISAAAIAGSGPVGGKGTGGNVSMIVNDGGIAFDGIVAVNAGGTSGASTTGAPAGNGLGGQILLRTEAGLAGSGLIAFDQMFVAANGAAGAIVEGGVGPGPIAGAAAGGLVMIDNLGGGINGNVLDIRADGFGGSSTGSAN
ncbi:MAG: hypothetical protein RLZZ58_1939, partial [Pseudomonadota bacterium]